MKSFAYHRPASLAGVKTALALPGARPLAGGMTLLPVMKQRLADPDNLVDLAGLHELSGIEANGDAVTIRAMTRHVDVARSAEVRRLIPALAELAGGIGDPQVRNRGTLGGSIANNDPAADYPAAVLALAATVVTDRRRIPADAFFTGLFETALEPAEIVTAVTFPAPLAAAYVKFPNPASRYAMVGVFVAKSESGVRVAVTGAKSCVFRATALETVLAAGFNAASLEDVRFPADDINSDIHADAAYRAHLIGVMTRRAVAIASAANGARQ